MLRRQVAADGEAASLGGFPVRCKGEIGDDPDLSRVCVRVGVAVRGVVCPGTAGLLFLRLIDGEAVAASLGGFAVRGIGVDPDLTRVCVRVGVSVRDVFPAMSGRLLLRFIFSSRAWNCETSGLDEVPPEVQCSDI
mmetsp:Transcript_59689/g.139681  ORF Transcript_59689/g.139681 Transcript_59689/m.139681 type:complete len:136 (-) Transcript_59689:401-808(-)